MDISRANSNTGIKPSFMGQTSFMSAEHIYPDFKAFLEQSPYVRRQPSRTVSTANKELLPLNEKGFNKGLDDYLDYFEIKKEKVSAFPSNFHSEIDELNLDVSPIKMAGHDDFPVNDFVIQPQELEMKDVDPLKSSGLGVLGLVGTSPTEMGSPMRKMTAAEIDKNTKKIMDTMQAKITKLEIENRKLKKEVSDLTKQNLKYQCQVASFISEQENYAKVRDTYEKRVKRLQEHCKNSDETMNALKRILSLQEEELIERAGKKELINGNTLLPIAKSPGKMSQKIPSARGSVKDTSFNLEDSRMQFGSGRTNRSIHNTGASPNRALQSADHSNLLKTPVVKGLAPIKNYFDFKDGSGSGPGSGSGGKNSEK